MVRALVPKSAVALADSAVARAASLRLRASLPVSSESRGLEGGKGRPVVCPAVLSGRPGFPVVLAGFLLLGASAVLPSAGALAKELPDYQPGDTASDDITTPFPLAVPDPEATETLRQKEALRVPAIFRFDPSAGDDAETRLRAAFDRTRGEFLDRVETVLGNRQVNTQAISSARFERLAGTFEKQRRSFPVSRGLLELWALGESDETIQDALVTKLRSTMARYLRADALPPDIKLGAQVRILAGTNGANGPTLAAVEQQGTLTPRTNVFTITRARAGLQQSFPPEESAAGRFLASFVTTNCALDADLTRQSRAKRTEPLYAADRYERGQAIVRQGQVIDAKAHAALDQLREKLKVGQLEQQVADEKRHVEQLGEGSRRLVMAFAAVVLALLVVLWRLLRRRPAPSLLPARVGHCEHGAAVIACPSCAENIIIPLSESGALDLPALSDASSAPWQHRALAAERRADRATAVVRAGLIPHLAQLMKNVVVQKLLGQRTDLFNAQQKAATEMAELEARLEKIHAPLHDRLKAYEKRIGELERELVAKGQQNRELIKTKIAMARRQLEAERAKTPAGWH